MGRIPMASTPSLRQLRSRHKCSVRRTSSALGEGVGQSADADIIYRGTTVPWARRQLRLVIRRWQGGCS